MASIDFTNGVTLSDASWADDVDVAAYSVLTSVSGTNTIVATGAATYSYAATRTPIWFIPANTNTGATTINVTPSGASALGAKNIFRNGVALVGGELRKNVPTALIYDGTQFHIAGAGGAASQIDLRSTIAGLVQSHAADTDHDITLSAGAASDSTNVYYLRHESAITKRIDAGWAVGTNQGGLDGTESVAGTPDANTWYYIWLIARSDTGVVDALFSESASAPTMPANYDYKRLVGAVKTDGSANIFAMDAYELSGGGLEVRWDDPPLDISLANTLTTTARTDTLSVPTSFSVIATLNVAGLDASTNTGIYISCPDTSDEAPSSTAAPLGQYRATTNERNSVQVMVRTSATGTIRSRADIATVDEYYVVTTGFEWSRR